MPDVRFYHVRKTGIDQTAFDLAERGLARPHTILIRLYDGDAVSRLDDFLWTAKPSSFLPHGTSGEKFAEIQPVCLTANSENPNDADMLMLMPGADTTGCEHFALICDLIDGHDESQVDAARSRFRGWKAKGIEPSYWQQSESGKWEKKA